MGCNNCWCIGKMTECINDKFLNPHFKIFKSIESLVKDFENLKNNDHIILPTIRENTKHSFHLFVIRSDKRNELSKYLNENGIETAVHYPVALVNMPAYAYLEIQPSDYPNSIEYQDKILSLPMYPELTEEQITYVSNKINFFFKSI